MASVAGREYKSSPETFMEIFGTTKPSQSAVIKWKSQWRSTKGRIEVKSFKDAIKLLDEAGVEPLFYQFSAEPAENLSKDKFFIVFYSEEHEVFFKLHNDLA